MGTDGKRKNGGASRDRTGDLYNAIVALSQLSYGPKSRDGSLGSVTDPVNSAFRVPAPRSERVRKRFTAHTRSRRDRVPWYSRCMTAYGRTFVPLVAARRVAL